MSASHESWVARHELASFFVLSYALAWLVWIPIGMLAPERLMSVMTLPGAWAPTFAAVIVSGIIGGRAAVKKLLRRGLKWRVGFRWYAVVLFGLALIGAAAVSLHVLLGGGVPQPAPPAGISTEQLYMFLPVIYLGNIFVGGPIAEEFGWRGFALPRLQARTGALLAGVVIGLAWGVWHLPFFIFPEGAAVVGGIPFAWYLPLVTAWSVLFTWIFNNTGGSVLMMILFHASINTTLGTLGLFRVEAEGVRPLALNLGLTVVAVVIIVIVCGARRLSPGAEARG